MTKRYDVVASFEYEDRNGETKKRYLRVGTAFENDKGISIKLDTAPVTKEWDGWLRLYEPKERDNASPQQQQRSEPKKHDDFDDDTPF